MIEVLYTAGVIADAMFATYESMTSILDVSLVFSLDFLLTQAEPFLLDRLLARSSSMSLFGVVLRMRRLRDDFLTFPIVGDNTPSPRPFPRPLPTPVPTPVIGGSSTC